MIPLFRRLPLTPDELFGAVRGFVGQVKHYTSSLTSSSVYRSQSGYTRSTSPTGASFPAMGSGAISASAVSPQLAASMKAVSGKR